MTSLPFWNVQNYPMDVLQRFWDKVQLEYLEDGSPNFEKCMIWIGSKSHGYGQFYYKRQYRAHRFSFECFNLDDITKLLICHKCDTPSCVNPHHLYKGTDLDNIQDCVQKGRNQKGRQEHTCVLTEQNVHDILVDIYNQKYTSVNILAAAYIVSISTIVRILDGITWSKETTEILANSEITLSDLRNMIMMKKRNILTENNVKIIKKMLNDESYSQADIARHFNVDPSTISMIRIGRNWSHIV